MQSLSQAQVVILAGGLGTRMRPVTEKIPKALIPAGGYPFLHWQLQQIKKFGIPNVLILTGHKGEMIEDYLREAPWSVLNIRCLNEGDPLKGTAGALRFALDKAMLQENFFLLYGDSYLPIDFASVWQRFQNSGKNMLMTVFENAGRFDKSNVQLSKDQSNVAVYDKFDEVLPQSEKSWIDYGLSILRRDVVSSVPANQVYDLAKIYLQQSQLGNVAAFVVQERFYEVGSPTGLADFENYLSEHELSENRGEP